MLRASAPLLAVLTLLSGGCKARNPDAAGLMSEPSASTGQEVAKGGDWTLSCVGAEGDANKSTYMLQVQGAVSPTDEGQDILVSANKTNDGHTESLADHEQGHGALSATGSLFLGFFSGVLTANPQAGILPATHSGVLTLAKDPNVEGLKVRCQLTKVSK